MMGVWLSFQLTDDDLKNFSKKRISLLYCILVNFAEIIQRIYKCIDVVVSLGPRFYFLILSLQGFKFSHRIKDDIMENSIKEIRIWHYAFAASIILCSTTT